MMPSHDFSPADTPPPWYRQGWPWFLIAIPATSVLLGILMITLAVRTDDALVIDDWYKQGKGINRRIERDGEATRLGVGALIRVDGAALVLDLAADSPDFLPPAALDVRWVHVTRAERDGGARLVDVGGGRYVAEGVALPSEGRWRVHVEPVVDESVMGESAMDEVAASTRDAPSGIAWRLVSDVTPLGTSPMPRLVAAPPGGDRR